MVFDGIVGKACEQKAHQLQYNRKHKSSSPMHFKHCILAVLCSIWEMQSKFCNGMPSDDCLWLTAHSYAARAARR